MAGEYEIVEESAEYRNGFNNAYLLAQHEPGLLDEILPSLNPSNDYFTGFFSGKDQWEQDKLFEQDQMQSNEQDLKELQELDQIRDQENELDQEIDHD